MKNFRPLLFLIAGICSLSLAGAPVSVILNGRVYRHAGVTARELGTGFFRSSAGDIFYLARDRDSFSFEPERQDFRFNNVRIIGSFPVRRKSGSSYFSLVDVNAVLRPLFATQQSVRRHALRKIVLDPGHGGFDRGAAGSRVIEKDFSLRLALRTAEILRRCGYTVLLTRNSDRLIPLNNRAAFANAARADIFVSLHCNASTDRRADGIESYCLTPAGAASTNQKRISSVKCTGNKLDPNNFLLAFELHRALLNRTRANDRGVRRGRFAVLRDLNMPGALLEVGFLSNPAEETRMRNAAYVEQLARGIAVGIINYHRRIYGRR